MRDPDLMQRADRAAVVLEQAWERWRAVHGLGAEPLPPVSSYVGYSLEEPWGQPRVVFGLRADEAELLASQLDGHECAGPSYVDAGARRRTTSGAPSLPTRPYGDSFSVPAQAPPPSADLLSPPVYGPLNTAAEDTPLGDAAARDLAAGEAIYLEEEPASVDEAWSGAAAEPAVTEFAAEADDVGDDGESPPLAPIPDLADVEEEAAAAGSAEPEASTALSSRLGPVPAQGPGYRGPRYQGFPPRYDPGPGGGRAPDRPAAAAPREEAGVADGEDEPAPTRRSHAAKTSRAPRRRAQGG